MRCDGQIQSLRFTALAWAACLQGYIKEKMVRRDEWGWRVKGWRGEGECKTRAGERQKGKESCGDTWIPFIHCYYLNVKWKSREGSEERSRYIPLQSGNAVNIFHLSLISWHWCCCWTSHWNTSDILHFHILHSDVIGPLFFTLCYTSLAGLNRAAITRNVDIHPF